MENPYEGGKDKLSCHDFALTAATERPKNPVVQTEFKTALNVRFLNVKLASDRGISQEAMEFWQLWVTS
jgi:hypothetical protein